MDERGLYNIIQNSIDAQHTYAGFSVSKITETLVRDVLAPRHNLTNAQIIYLIQNPLSTPSTPNPRLTAQLMGGGYYNGSFMDPISVVSHLDRCMSSVAYTFRNSEAREPYIGSRAFWRIGNTATPAGSPILFPQFLNMPWVHNVPFSATQMAFLRANPGVAVQITNYLIDAQPDIPGVNGNDPVVQTAAYKVAAIKGFTDLLADNPDLAQAYADAGFPLPNPSYWVTYVYGKVWNKYIEPYHSQYEALSEQEKSVVCGNPVSAFKVLENKNKAFVKIKSLCPNTWARNNNADAFVHAYWNALCARDLGWAITKLFTDAHESQYINHPRLAIEGQMDLHNNAKGIAIGSEPLNAGISDDALAAQIVQAIQNGQMWKISNVNYNLDENVFGSTGGLTPNSAITATVGNLCN